jgi:hypothetical protein
MLSIYRKALAFFISVSLLGALGCGSGGTAVVEHAGGDPTLDPAVIKTLEPRYSVSEVLQVYPVPEELIDYVEAVVEDLNGYKNPLAMYEVASQKYRMAYSIVQFATRNYVEDEIIVGYQKRWTEKSEQLAEDLANLVGGRVELSLNLNGYDMYVIDLPDDQSREQMVDLALGIWQKYGSVIQGIEASNKGEPLAAETESSD